MTKLFERPTMELPDTCPDWCNAPHAANIDRLVKERARLIVDGVIDDTEENGLVLAADVALEWRIHSATFGEGTFAASLDYDNLTGEVSIFGPETLGSMTAPEALEAAKNMVAAVAQFLKIEADQ